MNALRALVRKELAILFGSPLAYLTLTGTALITALLFFEHLRVYNQILFVYTSHGLGGFEMSTLPSRVNLQDQVFLPLMGQLSVTLLGIVPLLTMRVFTEERSRGTQELLLTSLLTPGEIVAGKFLATGLFVGLLLATSFLYPAVVVLRAGLGSEHLFAVYLGLLSFSLALAAIGLTCSAFTSNPLLAALSAYVFSFVFYDFGWADAFVTEPVSQLLAALALYPRFGGFMEGVIRLADLVYFAALVGTGFSLARLSFAWKRVR